MFGGLGAFGSSPEHATKMECEKGENRTSPSPRSAEEFRNLTLLVQWELSSLISWRD